MNLRLFTVFAVVAIMPVVTVQAALQVSKDRTPKAAANGPTSTASQSSDNLDDEFNRPNLNPNWHWIREDPTHWSLTASPGFLRIVTQSKDIWRGNNTAPLLLKAIPSSLGDSFEVRTRIVLTPIANHHQGGLVIYSSDDNYIRLTYAYADRPIFEFAKEVGGSFQPIQVPAPPGINDFHLRIVKIGAHYYGYYSQDGNNWTLIGTHHDVNISPSEFGLLAFNAQNVTSIEIPADFDYFRVLTQDSIDQDGDAIPDVWEVLGYDADGNGIVDIDLSAMGASPLRKDIFVEVDYMVDRGKCVFKLCAFGHSHKPNPTAIARVVEAFANAPVSNPDKSTGITLHVDVSEEIPHQDTLKPKNGQWSFAAGGNWSEVDRIKNDQGHFDPNRAHIYHYVIFAHRLGGMCDDNPCGATAGISRNDNRTVATVQKGASDFIVALGDWINPAGTMSQQAGTFMHEMGHNLGLLHGGDDDVNFKPNYLSVMNYEFTTSGLILNGRDGFLDYSRFGKIPPLNEAHLNETVGLNGGSIIAGYGTHYYCRPAGKWQDNRRINANDPIDWNCSGDAGGADVQANINDGNRDTPDSTISTLTSFDDWPARAYDGGSIGLDNGSTSVTSLAAQSVPVDELTYEIDSQLYRPYKIAVLGADDIVASLGISFTKVVTVTNLGALTATISVGNALGGGWFDLSSVPLSVTLSPRASLSIPITVTVPASRTGAITDSTTLTATIQESPLMGDSAILKVHIGPLAQFEAEPVNGTPPHAVTFTDYSVGQITSWSWNFGDRVTSTLPSPSHTYTMPGVYSVTLTIGSPDGSVTRTRPELIRVSLLRIYLPLILRNH